ncbi:FASTKD5 family protein [Megaselia abdita]
MNFSKNLRKISSSILQNHRRLHTTPIFQAKLFVDRENSHAHNILSSNAEKYKLFTELTISPVQSTKEDDLLSRLNSSEVTPSTVIKDFQFIASYCKNTETCISEDRFDLFVDNFTDNCRKFTESQVIEALQLLTLLPETPSVRSKNFLELWTSLDQACVSKADDWDIDTQLKVADAWYSLNLAKISDYVWLVMKKAGRKIRKLTPSQLVHVMFFCNVTRKPVLGEMIDFEMNLKEIVEELTIDEIAVMSMGFFKTKTPLRDVRFIEYLYKRLTSEISTVSDITFVSLLKILRYSSKFEHIAAMNSLLDAICPEIDRFSLLSCMHVALMGCDMQNSHPESIELVIKRFMKDIDSARIKDMERICHVISIYDFKTDSQIELELMKTILENLKTRTKEILKYPKCFPCMLHYMSLKGIYNEEMLSSIFDMEFVKHAYGTNLILGREMFSLDTFVKVNLKDSYKGNFLNERRVAAMGKCLTRYIPERGSKYKLAHTDSLLLDIKENSENLFKIATFKHILPNHERVDVVLLYDKEKKQFVAPSQKCPRDYSGTILTKDLLIDDPSRITAIVLICGGWNNYVRNTGEPTGLLRLKMEQLEILGYHSIPIPWYDWRLLESPSEKRKFLSQKINHLIH